MPDRPALLPRDSQTKIVATVGPACDSEDKLAELITAGVDVFRLNMAHADHRQQDVRLAMIRKAAARVGRRWPCWSIWPARRCDWANSPAGNCSAIRAIGSASCAAPRRDAADSRDARRPQATRRRPHDGHDARSDDDLRAVDRRVAAGRPHHAGRRHRQPRRGKGRQGFGRHAASCNRA